MIFSIAISLANAVCVIVAVETNTFDAWAYANLFFSVLFAFSAGTEK